MKVHVISSRQVYEMLCDDEWVHVEDPDGDGFAVEGVYAYKPTCDTLANVCIRLENDVLNHWKGEGLDSDSGGAVVETTTDLPDLRESLTTFGGVRVFTSVALHAMELQQ